MIITRISPLSGKTHTMDLDITEDQIARYQLGGELVQTVFPHLPPEEREFIMTGIPANEWDEAFAEMED